MFTGIVEATGTLIQREPTALVIRVPSLLTDVAIKDSIAVDGTCLTVTERGEDWLRVDTMPETLRCTRLGTLQSGDRVNLERSLPVDGRIGGHFVQGHVEAAVAVLSVEEDGIALHCTVENPAHLRPFIVPKGFVALNGVSLTVTTCGPESFSFALIPYTRQHTNLGEVHPGMLLNLETDIIGRTVAHLLHDSTWLDTLKHEA
ncbi:MAG: riboflavin synthase [Ktedonobacteraceae bacterium]|nr:riboflavin synthase [Ktedonobacteraceae bacterium]